ncbi:MAG: cyclase family protein [Flavobacteriaceae bacterium]|nr:MAG: cyclase family protein [Flavobacteriaceae bacterium]
MRAHIQYHSKKYTIDLSKPIDISIAIDPEKQNVNAWHIGPPEIYPVATDEWIGSVAKGADVNFNMITFNPHAHITHTETVGHITEKIHSINRNLRQYFFLSEVITVAPEAESGDFFISKKQLQYALGNKKREAVAIRTIPNTEDKKTLQYSNTNPPYVLEDATIYLREKGVKHLLVDLPSVDKEKDGGKLVAHHAFWNTAGKLRLDATITEFIFIPNAVEDGTYFLNLMIAPFENDASPSKPVLYQIIDD